MRSSPTFVTVIVSSYNQPSALRAVLEGFNRQDTRDFHLIVADDGSDAPTLEVVEEFRRVSAFPVALVKQQHRDFGKARILNLAVASLMPFEGRRQLLFCDGDSVPFRNLVSVHRRVFRPMTFIAGGNIQLDPAETFSFLSRSEGIDGPARYLTARRRRRLWHRQRSNIWAAALGDRTRPRLNGRNFSVDLAAFIAVNGFEEDYAGYSGEDTDIRHRLRNAGIRGISLWHRAIVCHLDHSCDEPSASQPKRKEFSAERLAANHARVWAVNGLSGHLVPGSLPFLPVSLPKLVEEDAQKTD